MSGATIEIRGLDVIQAALGRIDNLLADMAEPTRETLELLKRRMQDYPPPPAGSKYVRTYRLRNSWQEDIILSGNVLGRLESVNVPYAPYVQDEQHQAQIHQGRWQTRQQVAREEEQNVLALYEVYIQELINKL